MEGNGGNHLMGATRQLTQHMLGMGLVTRLFKDLTVEQTECIGAQNWRNRQLLLEQLGIASGGLLTRQAPHILQCGFTGGRLFGNSGRNHGVAHTNLAQQFTSTGRLGCKVQIWNNIGNNCAHPENS
jgi:hypothetical protein